MPRVVVTVLAPDRRLDLSVPDEVPVERLLPEIAQVFAANPDAGWTLTPQGGTPLPAARSLTESGIFHGALLLLELPQPRPPEPAPPPPIVRAPAAPSALTTLRQAVAAALRPSLPEGGDAAPYHFPSGVAPGAAPAADLLVVGGPGAGLRAALPAGQHRVGGHRYSRVVVDDPALSRVHLLVTVSPAGDVTVADAGSELGSFLDGVRLSGPAPVRPGQVVVAGRSLIAFARPGAPAEGPAAAAPAGPPAEIEAPPAQPRARWPLALGVAAVPGLVALIGLAASHLNPWWLLLLALSPAAVAAEPVLRQSAYRRATWAYRDRLARLDARLTAARSADAARMRRLTPDAVAVLALAGQPRPRQPDGADWLLVRVGWYDVASGLELRLPAGGDRLLRQEAMAALARHQALNAVPALVSLGDAGGLGVTGDRERVAGLCRWLGLQLATLHGAADLRLVAAAAAGDQETWSWLGWLPHAGLPGAPPGGVVAAGEAAGSLVEALLALVHERHAAGGVRQGPAVVAFLDAAGLAPGLVPRLLLRGPAVGVHVVAPGGPGQRTPAECGVVVDLPAGPQPPTLTFRRRGVRHELGGADGLPRGLAMEAAHRLAGRPAFPARVELADLLALPGPAADAERHVLESWIRDRSAAADRALAAACGVDADGRPVTVDLGLAGHLVVGGAEGSGKSELLRGLIVSLAVRRSPRTLLLAMIDPRSALGPCADLPHVVSHVTGLGGGAGRRALAWLEAELQRRAAVLREAGVETIEELEAAGPDRAPARLVVLADEVVDLLAHVPDAGRELVEAARAGRRLGVHLVLATGQAARLGPLPGPRVALRCRDERESEALIGSREAGRGGLPPGRGFLCTAPGQVTEFQAAVAGAQRLRRLVEAIANVNERLSLRPGGPATAS